MFRLKVFRLLREEGLIGEELVRDMLSWPHSGFHLYLGPLVSCLDSAAIEHMSQYSARGPVSLERMGILPGGGECPGQLRYEPAEGGEGDNNSEDCCPGREDLGRVICTSGKYLSKHKGSSKSFDPISFIAELTMHIPNRHQKTAIYYGRYSSANRGKRKKAAALAEAVKGRSAAAEALSVEAEAEDDRPSSLSKASWARFIKNVYEADPLLCPSCGGQMRIISFIEDGQVIYRILKHLNLLGQDQPARAPPAGSPPAGTESIKMAGDA